MSSASASVSMACAVSEKKTNVAEKKLIFFNSNFVAVPGTIPAVLGGHRHRGVPPVRLLLLPDTSPRRNHRRRLARKIQVRFSHLWNFSFFEFVFFAGPFCSSP
jgi:hypothetical protein